MKIENMIGALILAFILHGIGFGGMFVQATLEIFGIQISIATFYFIFFVIGVVLDILSTKGEKKQW